MAEKIVDIDREFSTTEVVDSSYDVRDYRIAAEKEFPETFELSKKVNIKNQGSKPTCVAHALSSLVEYHNLVETGKYRKFSTEFIYGTRDIGYYIGDGMMIRDALKTIQKYGDCYYTDCSGNSNVQDAMNKVNEKVEEYRDLAYPHRVGSYYRVKTPEEIKTALMNHGPVVISMTCKEGARIVDDTYTFTEGAKDSGRHCVLIVGWNEKGWIVQNSWGIWYAGDGYFTLPFDFKLNEAWGTIDQEDDYSLLKRKARNKFMNKVYEIINKIVNWFYSRKKQKES